MSHRTENTLLECVVTTDHEGNLPLVCVCKRYVGLKTYWRLGYHIYLLALESGELVEEEYTTSPQMGAYACFRFTETEEDIGLYPDLLEMEDA